MKRNVEMYIQEYKRLFSGNKEKYSASDIIQLYDMANKDQEPLWVGTTSALMFGFMVGMKYQKRQQKKVATKH